MPERMTKPTLRLLEVMLGDPAREWYGLELMDVASLTSGTVYPLLHRLESDGWLSSAREAVSPVEIGRPRRRLYRLTATGEKAARTVVRSRSVRAPGLGFGLPRGASA